MVGTNQWKLPGKTYRASDIIVHDQYVRHMLGDKNDIALIRVEKRIEFNEKVQPIKYSAEVIPSGMTLLTTGWGRLSVCVVSIEFLKFPSLIISIYSKFHRKMVRYRRNYKFCTQNRFQTKDVNNGWRDVSMQASYVRKA